jgi:glycosyltransferase involved in cell wall biosynthesis
MRLLFIADGRSPTTLSWLHHWIENGHQVHLVSTFPCKPPPGLVSLHILPVGLSWLVRGLNNQTKPTNQFSKFSGWLRGVFHPFRTIFGPLSLLYYQPHFRKLVKVIHPELVHALRIPFEGMLASATPAGFPLVISVWGNDFTLHARSSILMARFTQRTLLRADGLLADAKRDIRLSHEWGFSASKPTLVVPGSGGIRFDEIDIPIIHRRLPEELPDVPIVVNPRGRRPGSLQQEVFIHSIPLVLDRIPQAMFICPSMAGDPGFSRLVKHLGIEANTRLWPYLSQEQMWTLFKRSQVYVSPSVHDGTPNSLLEAMVCGCFPVVGNIESMQEWITSGVNGLLIDANSASSLADGIIFALENPALRKSARSKNTLLITERADNHHCMAMTEVFYEKLLKGNL